MKNKKFILQLIPILLCSFVAWFYTMQYTPLAYIYNSFPGQDALVMMVVTIPPLAGMAASFLSGVAMSAVGKKTWITICMACTLLGGAVVFFWGDKSLFLTIVGSSMTGIAAGGVPPVCYATLAEIAPENMRDKVIGWNDSVCTLGALVCAAAGGYLAKDGTWMRAFGIYLVILPILFLVAVFFPKDAPRKGGQSDKKEEAAAAQTVSAKKPSIPAFVIALIVIKVVSSFFYMGKSLFFSDYFINEMGLGDSAVLGYITSLSTAAGLVAAAILFLWIRTFRGFSSLASLTFIGLGTLMLVLFPNVPVCILGTCMWAFGSNSYHSGTGTVISMGAKGQIVGTVASLYIGASYLGESLAGYVLPWLSKLILGVSSASNCLLVAGVASIVLGVISVPFFKKGYPIAFPDNGKKAE